MEWKPPELLITRQAENISPNNIVVFQRVCFISIQICDNPNNVVAIKLFIDRKYQNPQNVVFI